MRPWIEWLARVGVAGAWIMAAGCGGGDVPDPGSDSTAATDAPPESGGAPPAAAPSAAPGPGPAAGPMRGRPGMMASKKGQASPAANEAGEDDGAAQPPAADNPPPAKTEGGATTAEMLSMATGGQGSSGSSASSGGDTAGGQGAPPGGPGGPMQGRPGGPPQGSPGMSGSGRPGGPGGGMAGMPGGPGQPGGPSGGQPQGQGGAPGSSGGGYSDQMARMMQQRQGGPGGSGSPGAPGGPPMANQGGPGGSGGPGRMGFGAPGQQDNGPADTQSPDGAVRAFLNALRDKDRDRLAEATALRSQTEASSEKKKELFAKVVDMSISDSELDDIAKTLDGYRVAGENAAKSTKSLGIIIRKTQENGDFLSRTVTVRKEKKGWGVLDLSEAHLFKSMRMQPARRSTGGR